MPVLLRTLVFAIFVPGSVTVGMPFLILWLDEGTLSYDIGAFRFVGALPMAVGAAIVSWCALDFALVGKGTPLPIDAPRRLVSSGLYRLVRNPMYVGVDLILLGEALVFHSLALVIYAVIVGSLFYLFVVYVEEPGLRERFGLAYEEYCKAVPRWVPRLHRL